MISYIWDKLFPPLHASDILSKQIERTKMDLLTHLELKQHSSAMVTMLSSRLKELSKMEESNDWSNRK
jgi:hypothetical protein